MASDWAGQVIVPGSHEVWYPHERHLWAVDRYDDYIRCAYVGCGLAYEIDEVMRVYLESFHEVDEDNGAGGPAEEG